MYRKLSTALAILATTAGVSALASSAQAQISGTIGGDVVDNDSVALLGDPDAEVTLTDGNVAFDWTQGKVTPRLTAKLHIVHGNHACYRVNIESYDLNNTRLHSNHGGEQCPDDAKELDRTVDLSGASDPLINHVSVAVQRKTGSGGWETRDSYDLLYVNMHSDAVTISGGGVGVTGTVGWRLDETGKSIGTYTGDLAFPGITLPGRVSLRYIDDAGNKVDQVDGPTHKPGQLGASFPDTLAAAPSSSAIKVKIVMQTRNGGTWIDDGAQTVSIAE